MNNDAILSSCLLSGAERVRGGSPAMILTSPVVCSVPERGHTITGVSGWVAENIKGIGWKAVWGIAPPTPTTKS